MSASNVIGIDKVVTSENLYQSTEQLVAELVYICDFDSNDNCGGTLFANNSGLSHTFSASIQSQVIVTTTVTDITSISKYFKKIWVHQIEFNIG